MVVKIKGLEEEKKDFNPQYSNNTGIQRLQENTDVAQTIIELNDDSVDKDMFTKIDMKSILHPIEVSSIIGVDILVLMNVLPMEASFIPRSKKRLSVSQNGKGRDQIVQISQGMQEQKARVGMMDGIRNFFGGVR